MMTMTPNTTLPAVSLVCNITPTDSFFPSTVLVLVFRKEELTEEVAKRRRSFFL
jgi:hypothetical protein